MTKLLIHAGVHKTGSTSFQIFLAQNEKLLERNKIFRIKSLEDGDPTCHQLAHAFINKDEEKIKKYELELVRFLKKAKPKKDDNFILSSEEFDRLDDNAVERLCEVFEPHFEEINVGIYIRPHAALIDSQHSQQLREGFIRLRLDPFFRTCVKHARFVRLSSIVSSWVAAFGKDRISVRSAQMQDLYKKDIASDILKHFFNFEIPKNAKRVQRVNEKLSPVAREALVQILHDSRLAKLDYLDRRHQLTTYLRNAPTSDIIKQPGEGILSYGLIAASSVLFKEDYDEINSAYFKGSLKYGDWYKKQINGFDRYIRNQNEDSFSSEKIAVAKNQYWSFVESLKNESRVF